MKREKVGIENSKIGGFCRLFFEIFNFRRFVEKEALVNTKSIRLAELREGKGQRQGE
jgi:hypothetical protein